MQPYVGSRMVPLSLKVLAKFGLFSNCSQKLDECSLVHARKNFATACMLGFSLKFPYGKTEKHWGKCKRYEFCWKHTSSFCLRFLETDACNNSSRKALSKVESSLETWRHVEYYYYYIHTYIALFVNAGWEMGSQRLMWTCLYNYNILRFKIQIKLVNK